MLRAEKVGNLVRPNRCAESEGVQYVFHDHRLLVEEVNAVVHGAIELLCFSNQVVEEHDATGVCFRVAVSKNYRRACLLDHVSLSGDFELGLVPRA